MLMVTVSLTLWITTSSLKSIFPIFPEESTVYTTLETSKNQKAEVWFNEICFSSAMALKIQNKDFVKKLIRPFIKLNEKR